MKFSCGEQLSGRSRGASRPQPMGALQIDELEEQCSEINREKERNTQLKRRIEELESELREKETVSGGARRPCAPGTRQVSRGRGV